MSLSSEKLDFEKKFKYFNLGDNPGLAVMAIKNEHIIFKSGYGLRNLETKERITPDTNFRMASVSKQFTAMAIAILQEQEEISYEDRLTKYFPDFPNYGKDITVKHLIHHMSGLPDYQMDLCSSDIDAVPITNLDVYSYLKKKTKLIFKPGNRFEYSNTGYNLLGTLIEKISGLTFKEFVEKHIFFPAKMIDSKVICFPENKIKNRALGYSEWPFFELNDYNSGNYLYGEDGIYTSLEDMAEWIMSIESNLFVSNNMKKIIFTGSKTNQGDAVEYGYGWELEDYYNHRMFFHGGGWVGFNTWVANFPDQRLWLVAFANSPAISSYKAIEAMAKHYLQL